MIKVTVGLSKSDAIKMKTLIRLHRYLDLNDFVHQKLQREVIDRQSFMNFPYEVVGQKDLYNKS